MHAPRLGAAVVHAALPAPRGAAGPRAPLPRQASTPHPALSAPATRGVRRRAPLPPRAFFEVLEKGFASALRTLNDTDDLSAVRHPPPPCAAAPAQAGPARAPP